MSIGPFRYFREPASSPGRPFERFFHPYQQEPEEDPETESGSAELEPDGDAGTERAAVSVDDQPAREEPDAEEGASAADGAGECLPECEVEFPPDFAAALANATSTAHGVPQPEIVPEPEERDVQSESTWMNWAFASRFDGAEEASDEASDEAGTMESVAMFALPGWDPLETEEPDAPAVEDAAEGHPASENAETDAVSTAMVPSEDVAPFEEPVAGGGANGSVAGAGGFDWAAVPTWKPEPALPGSAAGSQDLEFANPELLALEQIAETAAGGQDLPLRELPEPTAARVLSRPAIPGDSHLRVPALEHAEALRMHLEEFLDISKCLTALFVTRQGLLVARAGRVHSLDGESIAALVAGTFAATRELARLLGEKEFPVMLHQGRERHIHLEMAAEDLLLVAVFDDGRRAGAVRHAAHRVAAAAQALLARAPREPAARREEPPVASNDFRDHAFDLIDRLFH